MWGAEDSVTSVLFIYLSDSLKENGTIPGSIM